MSPAVERLWRQLTAHGSRIALSDGERQWRYAELQHEVIARQAVLHRCRARRLAIALDNGPDWLLWDLAALFAGVVCVPLPISEKLTFLPARSWSVLYSGRTRTCISSL